MKLTGLIAATHTPYDSAGDVNLAAIPAQAEWLLKNGIRCAFICGSTGESHSLSLNERIQIAKRWVEVTKGSHLKVVVHVGSNCIRDAATLAEQAQKPGVTAIAALAPCYFRPATVSVLVDSMMQIASRAPDLPFYFYDIPAMTGVRLPMPQFLDEAASRIPNLAGLKFTNEDYPSLQNCLAADNGRWDILWGVDESLLGALALGAGGAVGSSYNFAAGLYHRLIAAFRDGDLTTARRYQLDSVKLIQCIAGYGYLPAAKHVMEMLGVPVGGARLPLSPLSSVQKTALRSDLEKLGFFAWAVK